MARFSSAKAAATLEGTLSICSEEPDACASALLSSRTAILDGSVALLFRTSCVVQEEGYWGKGECENSSDPTD